jgi:hypothetical protein
MVFGSGKDVGELLQIRIRVIVDQLVEVFADALGQDLGLRAFISIYSRRSLWAEEARPIAVVKSSHARLNTSLPLSSLALAPAQ